MTNTNNQTTRAFRDDVIEESIECIRSSLETLNAELHERKRSEDDDTLPLKCPQSLAYLESTLDGRPALSQLKEGLPDKDALCYVFDAHPSEMPSLKLLINMFSITRQLQLKIGRMKKDLIVLEEHVQDRNEIIALYHSSSEQDDEKPL